VNPLAEERQNSSYLIFQMNWHNAFTTHNIQPTEAEKQSGFCMSVQVHPPITITEGAKKTLSSLSQGKLHWPFLESTAATC